MLLHNVCDSCKTFLSQALLVKLVSSVSAVCVIWDLYAIVPSALCDFLCADAIEKLLLTCPVFTRVLSVKWTHCVSLSFVVYRTKSYYLLNCCHIIILLHCVSVVVQVTCFLSLAARATLRLVRARLLCQMWTPYRPITTAANWLTAFWLHRAVTLPRPNTYPEPQANQSELLKIFHSHQLCAPKHCGPGYCSTPSPLNVALLAATRWLAEKISEKISFFSLTYNLLLCHWSCPAKSFSMHFVYHC